MEPQTVQPTIVGFETSEETAELFEALSKVQGEIQNAHKKSKGYNYTYADLSACYEVSREPMAKHGLALTQFPLGRNGMISILCHKSGQWMRAPMAMTPKDNSPQAVGSVLTYMRRYAHNAILAIGADDDDGQTASGSVFDKRNSDHLSWVRKVLGKWGIDLVLTKDFSDRMHGKPFADIEVIKQEIEKERSQ